MRTTHGPSRIRRDALHRDSRRHVSRLSLVSLSSLSRRSLRARAVAVVTSKLLTLFAFSFSSEDSFFFFFENIFLDLLFFSLARGIKPERVKIPILHSTVLSTQK